MTRRGRTLRAGRHAARVRSVVAARAPLPDVRVRLRRRHALPLVDHVVPALAGRARRACRDVVRAARRPSTRRARTVGPRQRTPIAISIIRTRTTCSGPLGSSSARISSRSGCCSWSWRSISSRPRMGPRRPRSARRARSTGRAERGADRRLRRGFVESPGLEQRRAPRGLARARRRCRRGGAARAVRSRQASERGLARRRHVVRGRELPSVRASRSLVRRDDRRRRPAYDSTPALVARFDEAFATPFVTALPDFTFPSRRDSQYAVSLRQWRFAELAELGVVRRPDDDATDRRARDVVRRVRPTRRHRPFAFDRRGRAKHAGRRAGVARISAGARSCSPARSCLRFLHSARGPRCSRSRVTPFCGATAAACMRRSTTGTPARGTVTPIA